MIVKHTAVSHSKLRKEFGIVGVEANSETRIIKVKFARQWSRAELGNVPQFIKKYYDKIKWDVTYVDQLTGEHFINDMKKLMNVKVITTKKLMNDPKEIVKIQVMDKVELVQWMLVIGQNKQIEFPPNPSEIMKELESQMGIFAEMTTEAGGIDYFSPGDQFDNLVRALMVACFSVRQIIEEYTGGLLCGSVDDENPEIRDPEQEFYNAFPQSESF